MDENTELEGLLKPQDENENSENLADDDNILIEDKVVKLAESNKQLFARAKKAELELKALRDVPKEQVVPVSEVKPQPKVDDIGNIIEQKLGERELDTLGLSEETQNKIKAYAKAENTSIKQAMKSDYFTFVKDKDEQARKVDEASIGGKRGASTSRDYSTMKPDDFDLSTEEGRKAWGDYKKSLK